MFVKCMNDYMYICIFMCRYDMHIYMHLEIHIIVEGELLQHDYTTYFSFFSFPLTLLSSFLLEIKLMIQIFDIKIDIITAVTNATSFLTL